MKSPEAALRTLLLESPETAEAFGTEVYPVIAPTSASHPFVVYRRTGILRESTFGGPLGHPKVSVDITVFDDTYEGARRNADLVRLVVDGFSGDVGDVLLQQVYVDNESDDFVQLGGSEMPPTYSVTLSLETIWEERK